MNYLDKMFNSWLGKLIISVLVTLFSPFQVPLIVLCAMIVIDTITGSLYALSISKFSSKRFKLGLRKILLYFTCILVVRLIEIGVSGFLSMGYLTGFIGSYLILTEGFSTLENLTLLGVPLPYKIKEIIIKQLNNKDLGKFLSDGMGSKEYIQEILDMAEYHVPQTNNKDLKNVIDIMLHEWVQFVNILNTNFYNNFNEDTELVYFRVSSLINATMNRIFDRLSHEVITKEILDAFNAVQKNKINSFMNDIKNICCNSETSDRKKQQIIEKVISMLYQTLTDLQKSDI